MITTKSAWVEEPKGEYSKDRIVQRKNLDVVLKLEDIQKMFIPGSETYYKVQDIINELNKNERS